MVERRPVPRFFKLAYLITAWTQRPEDEHRLLSAVLACFMQYDTVPDSALTPLLRDLETPLQVMIAYPPPENRQVSDVWSSLGGDLKPSVDLVITMAIQPDTLYEIAQAVMAPLRLRAVGHTTYDVEDDIRHLRDPDAPDGAGGAAGRARAGSGRCCQRPAPQELALVEARDRRRRRPVGGQRGTVSPPASTPLGRPRWIPRAGYLLARLRIVESAGPGPGRPAPAGRPGARRIPSSACTSPTSTSTACWPAARSLRRSSRLTTPGWPPFWRRRVASRLAGASRRLSSLAQRAGLDELDVELLLVALAPDLDSRFERLYGYLNDDVTRRRATIGLGLELCGTSAWSGGSQEPVLPGRTADRRRAGAGGGARPALPVPLAAGAGPGRRPPARRRPARPGRGALAAARSPGARPAGCRPPSGRYCGTGCAWSTCRSARARLRAIGGGGRTGCRRPRRPVDRPGPPRSLRRARRRWRGGRTGGAPCPLRAWSPARWRRYSTGRPGSVRAFGRAAPDRSCCTDEPAGSRPGAGLFPWSWTPRTGSSGGAPRPMGSHPRRRRPVAVSATPT